MWRTCVNSRNKSIDQLTYISFCLYVNGCSTSLDFMTLRVPKLLLILQTISMYFVVNSYFVSCMYATIVSPYSIYLSLNIPQAEMFFWKV